MAPRRRDRGLPCDAGFTHAYAVDEAGTRVVAIAIAIDPATGALTRQGDPCSGGSGPAHVAIADGHAVVAVAAPLTVQAATLVGIAALP